MATRTAPPNGETYFFYFHCWCGLGDTFPHYDLAEIAVDDQGMQKAENTAIQLLLAEFSKQHASIIDARRQRGRRKILKAAAKQDAEVRERNGKRPPVNKREDKWQRFLDAARVVGWGRPCSGPLMLGGKPCLLSPRAYLGEFPDMDSAQEAADRCREIIPFINNEKDKGDLLTINPRFGIAPSTSFTPAKVATIRQRLDAMRTKGDGEPFARIAKPFLDVAQGIIRNLSVALLGGHGADENGQKPRTNGGQIAGDLPLFPKGDLPDKELQTCIEHLHSHRGNGKNDLTLLLEKTRKTKQFCESIQGKIRKARRGGWTNLRAGSKSKK